MHISVVHLVPQVPSVHVVDQVPQGGANVGLLKQGGPCRRPSSPLLLGCSGASTCADGRAIGSLQGMLLLLTSNCLRHKLHLMEDPAMWPC